MKSVSPSLTRYKRRRASSSIICGLFFNSWILFLAKVFFCSISSMDCSVDTISCWILFTRKMFSSPCRRLDSWMKLIIAKIIPAKGRNILHSGEDLRVSLGFLAMDSFYAIFGMQIAIKKRLSCKSFLIRKGRAALI